MNLDEVLSFFIYLFAAPGTCWYPILFPELKCIYSIKYPTLCPNLLNLKLHGGFSLNYFIQSLKHS